MKSFVYKGNILKAKYAALNQYGRCVTRRLIKPQPEGEQFITSVYGEWCLISDGGHTIEVIKPSYQEGEVVYWREPFCWKVDQNTSEVLLHEFWYQIDDDGIEYTDDGWGGAVVNKDGTFKSPWKSPYAMKESYARTFVKITDVRPERLQDIKNADIQLEGTQGLHPLGGLYPNQWRTQFSFMWDSTTKAGNKWQDNPWVWRIEMEKVK
jgi:hypothetical protein